MYHSHIILSPEVYTSLCNMTSGERMRTYWRQGRGLRRWLYTCRSEVSRNNYINFCKPKYIFDSRTLLGYLEFLTFFFSVVNVEDVIPQDFLDLPKGQISRSVTWNDRAARKRGGKECPWVCPPNGNISPGGPPGGSTKHWGDQEKYIFCHPIQRT